MTIDKQGVGILTMPVTDPVIAGGEEIENAVERYRLWFKIGSHQSP